MVALTRRRNGITCSCAGGSRWLPTPVDSISKFLDSAIPRRDEDNHGYIVNKNVAYNLQYCQYIEKTLREGLPTSVLNAQHTKSYIIHVTAAVEAALEYILRSKAQYTKKQLKLSDIKREWRRSLDLNIDKLLEDLDDVIAVRNRIHLIKHEDNPNSACRDTTYNFFLGIGSGPATRLLETFIKSEIFKVASNREEIVREFTIMPD
jgi:hypothetical protein